ncbi:hypothetical protein [Rhodococcus sp. ACPA1]|uniref:hypothetical protein n=1 Tax=Rhodococcus sp. ACPA1 TaxID=2028572 RepID=UPI000BB0FFBE|nr:hypothetical protein [Rhodococcus sp. ACPA1]PBC45341.1 hypothetical protein CJ177_46370 [Rhodococcus sp. ACPA1]
MTKDGRERLGQALRDLLEKVPASRGKQTYQLLADGANAALRNSRRPGYRGPWISRQSVGFWIREGKPAKDEHQLRALVEYLHTLAGSSAAPMRWDEWKTLYVDAMTSDSVRRTDPETETTPGDRAPLEIHDDVPDESPADLDHRVERRPWLDSETETALRSAVRAQTPARSVAVFGRWWQLESWLRELLYLELRAKLGTSWTSALSPEAASRLGVHRTRGGADEANPLAHLHYEDLVQVINEHWDVMSYALPERRSWDGQQHELEQIRGRLGYLHHPHPDDLGRLEQTLRDLEHGAFVAVDSYTTRWRPKPEKHKDVVTQDWIARQHVDAQRLLSEYVDRDYGTLLIQASRRPWKRVPVKLANAPGMLWHAELLLRRRHIDPVDLWSALNDRNLRQLLVHITIDPYQVGFTFSAVDDERAVSDAIGRAFDSTLSVSRHGRAPDEYEDYQARARSLDFRVQSGTGWTIGATAPMQTFGAGGSVDVAPTW